MRPRSRAPVRVDPSTRRTRATIPRSRHLTVTHIFLLWAKELISLADLAASGGRARDRTCSMKRVVGPRPSSGRLTLGGEGGFKGSSQHLDGGGCDEGWETALGSGATSRVAGVAWPTRRGAAGEPGAGLGGDCGGSVERGRGDRGRRVARGGGPLVPGGGRHATDDTCAISEAAIGAVSGVR